MSGLMSGSALERLVELSVCKKARLDSDSTLVAVITAVSDVTRPVAPGSEQGLLYCIDHQFIIILFKSNILVLRSLNTFFVLHRYHAQHSYNLILCIKGA